MQENSTLVTNYTGHSYDPILGIYYAKARMYDTVTANLSSSGKGSTGDIPGKGSDVSLAETALNDWLIDHGISITQNQFDSLIMMRHIRGVLGDRILGLIENNASRSIWESINGLGIGDDDRKKAELDLYFDGIYTIDSI